MQQAVSWSQSKKISEEANTEVQSILAGLCESMKDVKGTVNEVKGTMQSFSGEMKGDVNNLEAKMAVKNGTGIQERGKRKSVVDGRGQN